MMLSQLLQVGRFISASNFRRGIHRGAACAPPDPVSCPGSIPGGPITDDEEAEDAAGDDWDDEDMEEDDE